MKQICPLFQSIGGWSGWEEEGGSQTSKELNAEIHVTRVELFPLEKN